MAIGTETEGSLISPSTRQSLYTVKPALGSVPNEGIMPVSVHLDVAGPMCTTVQDTADLLTVLMGDNKPDVPLGGYAAAMKGAAGWAELRIGALDPETFRYDASLQTPIPEAIEQIVRPRQCFGVGVADDLAERGYVPCLRPYPRTCQSVSL